jgi:hypothetical protein
VGTESRKASLSNVSSSALDQYTALGPTVTAPGVPEVDARTVHVPDAHRSGATGWQGSFAQQSVPALDLDEDGPIGAQPQSASESKTVNASRRTASAALRDGVRAPIARARRVAGNLEGSGVQPSIDGSNGLAAPKKIEDAQAR